MNNDGRKRIDAVIRDIEKLEVDRIYIDEMLVMATEKLERWKDAMADIATQIEELKDEESDKFENMSEGFQHGDRGQAIEAAVQQLETAFEAVNEFAELEGYTLEVDVDSIITALD